MSATANCPAVHDLQRLLLGQVPRREAEGLEEHLAHCARCAERATGLRADDTLVEAMRAAPAGTDDTDPDVVAGLIRRLKSWPRPPAGITTASDLDSAPSSTPLPATEAPPDLADFLAPAAGPDELGRLGGYRVLRILGSGGMGIVLLAEDPQLQRSVALKVMKPALAASATARQRFLREARAMAAVRHEHVVTVYQVGEDRGVPFLAMEYLEGATLAERLRGGAPWRPAQVVRLGLQVTEGLAAAHARGLVHRDIKPANLWLEPVHGGHVKILDFGLARPAGEDARLTQSGCVVGTPAYMAPEQADGQAVDARCDLFSLGGVLYQLCTSRLPFPGATTLATLRSLAQDQPAPPHELNPEVPRELSDLVLRLLAKDPAGRPPSARAVAEALRELQRRLAPPPAPVPSVPEPQVAAAAPAKPQAAAARRRRLLVAVAAGLLALLGGGLLLQQIVIRIKDRDGKVVSETTVPKGQTLEIEQDGKVVATLPAPGKPTEPPAVQPEPLPPLKGTEPLSPLALVQRPATIKGVRSWTVETLGHRGWVRTVAFSPDGRLLASGGDDGSIRVWEVDNGRLYRVLIGHGGIVGLGVQNQDARALAWSPDGRALASGGADGTIRLWQVDSGRLLRTLQAGPGKTYPVLWSPDGKQLASGAEGGPARLWDAASGQLRRELKWEGGLGIDAAWSPDGKVIATAGGDGILRLWDAAADKLLATVKLDGPVGDLAWSHDGTTLAVRDSSHFRLVERRSGKLVKDIQGGGCLFWMPGDKELLTISPNGEAGFWQAREGRRIRGLSFPSETPLSCAACSPDGKVLAGGDFSGAVRFWDAEKGDSLQALAGHGESSLAGLVWSPDGRQIMRSERAWGGLATSWWDIDANPPSMRGQLPGVGQAWSPDGRKMAVGGPNGNLVIQDARTGKEVRVLKGYTAAWAPDGSRLASGSEDARVRLWDPASGKLLHTWDGYKDGPPLVSWSPDGKRLATGSIPDKALRILDVTTGKVAATVPTGQFPLVPTTSWGLTTWGVVVVWSPDGKKLATGGATLDIWDVASGQKEDTYDVPPGGVAPLAWLADGSLAAVTDQDRTLRVWNASGRLARTVRLPARGVLSPDWRRLASPGACAAWLWDVESGRCRGTLVELRNDRHLALSADGHYAGSPRLERDLVCVIETEQGQATLTPEEFAQQYGWKNDPDRVRLTAAATAPGPGGAPSPTAPDQPGPVVIQPEPLPLLKGGEPLSPLALVQRPAEIKGVRSWTVLPRGHQGGVFGLGYSPDGKWLASGGRDGIVRVWEAASGRLVRALFGHSGTVEYPRWSPDGKVLASSSHDGTIRLWNVESGQLLRTLRGHEGAVIELAWSPNGRVLASAGRDDDTVRLWEPESGRLLRTLKGHTASVWAPAWSPDGARLASDSADGSVRFWNATSGECLATEKVADGLWGFDWSPDGNLLACGDADGNVYLLDGTTGKKKGVLQEHAATVGGVKWSADGRFLATASNDGTIRVWARETRETVHTLKPGGSSLSISWSPDSRALASSSHLDGRIHFWDVGTGAEQRTLEGHDSQQLFGWGLAVSPDGKTLASSTTDGGLQLWQLESGQLLRKLEGHKAFVNSIAWSPDGEQFASCSDDCQVRLWTVDGKSLHTLPAHQRAVFHAAWSPDGRSLASGGDEDSVWLWDTATGKSLRRIRVATKAVVDRLAWSPNGKVLALATADSDAGGMQYVIHPCDPDSGKVSRTLPGHSGGIFALAWSPDGTVLASGSADKTVRLWDTATGQLLDTLEGHRDSVSFVAWLPGGKSVASAGADATVRYWDTRKGELRRTLSLPGGAVLSPDGRFLVGGDFPPARTELQRFPAGLQFWEAGAGGPRGALTLLRNDQWLAVGADGHYRGSPHVERKLVYVVQTEQGQETLTPDEFAQKYGWKNDPDKVRLTAAPAPAAPD